MSLHSIDLQMSNVHEQIYNLNYQMDQRREDLERLEQVISDVKLYQQEYNQSKKHWEQPLLTHSTWAGDFAEQFESIREENIRESYHHVSRIQLDQILHTLLKARDTLRSEVTGLESDIQHQELRLDDLEVMKREEQFS
ncbi:MULTISPECIES: DUF5082 family protein [Oceanobacillus]|uniref:DUF5082 domain-containing protein n=1 Tax=Oceanobacillus kimchii TaxID=746691 RepID=A0ABQ5TM99_9BACI|nr:MULTISPECIES: DUF5082 family protein [Oceanobacillus]MBT2600207.1 DUF5082 family protein [Oceanobacillus sp. ISL-74]MBT2650365.1 DUF5082 family protein [Oceanobacillus sp. ISL-73]MCT1578108.1 DUF5082 domain-containing protein [Oceanobacillus kimchii]MCT2134286.1 DUF5082 domain-containing protein [Oceanobacillus kimchii]OEH55082.1 hypothetical protein AQ616_08535 [Oceanobacillus sp. E9]